MPEQLLATYMEKGFFAAIGFILTGLLALVGFHAKKNSEFRTSVHKKIDENAKRVIDNHPSKDEFAIAFKALGKQLDSVQKDIREVREKL